MRIIKANNLLPRDIRTVILVTDQRRCVFCGATYRLEIDHVVPKAAGRDDDLSNLAVLCRVHNRIKSDYRVGPDGKPVYHPFACHGDVRLAARILAAELRAMRAPMRRLRLFAAKRRYL